MNLEELREYCLSKPGVTEETPFKRHPNVLVFKVLGKIFVATDLEIFDSISLKYFPKKILYLKQKYHFVNNPEYFSAKHWVKVGVRETDIDFSIIQQWVDVSYELVRKGLTKKQQEQLHNFLRS